MTGAMAPMISYEIQYRVIVGDVHVCTVRTLVRTVRTYVSKKEEAVPCGLTFGRSIALVRTIA